MQHAKKVNKFSINFGVSNLDFFSSTTPLHLAMSVDKSLTVMNMNLLDFVKFLYNLSKVVYKSCRSYPDAFISLSLSSYRQAHKMFFKKSDLFFICMMHPLSSDIKKQDLEIEAAQVNLG